MLSSRNFIILHFTFRSMIRFELIFVKGMRSMSKSPFYVFCFFCTWMSSGFSTIFWKDFLFFFLIYLFYYFWLCWVFVSVRGLSLVAASGATLHRVAQASHCPGLSCCGAQAPDAQAQQLWLTGPVAPRHMGSSQTRARTRVPRIGRQTLNHCATREALFFYY